MNLLVINSHCRGTRIIESSARFIKIRDNDNDEIKARNFSQLELDLIASAFRAFDIDNENAYENYFNSLFLDIRAQKLEESTSRNFWKNVCKKKKEKNYTRSVWRYLYLYYNVAQDVRTSAPRDRRT